MTTGRINQISIGADETAGEILSNNPWLEATMFWSIVFFVVFWFWIKKQNKVQSWSRSRWEFLHSRCDHYKIWFCYYLLTSFSGWNPSERYIKMYRFPIFIQPSFSCVWKRKNSQPTSESRHGRNDVINGKPLKNTQAEDERFVWVDRSVESWNF